jgi:hypothetical protein
MKYALTFDNEDLYMAWVERVQAATGVLNGGTRVGRRIIVPIYMDIPDVGIEVTRMQADEAEGLLFVPAPKVAEPAKAVKHSDEIEDAPAVKKGKK